MRHSVDLTGVCANTFCTYKEYGFRSRLDTWGEGLLDRKLGNDKSINIDADVPSDSIAELFAFGTGKLPSTVLINGNETELPTLDTQASGRKVYTGDEDHSVHRTYHRVLFPAEWLRRGENTVTFPPVHAYILVLVVRVYEDAPARCECKFQSFVDEKSLSITLVSGVPEDTHHVDFLGRFVGYDENQNGLVEDWHANAEFDPTFPSGYRLAGHLGTASRLGETVSGPIDLFPAGPVEIRARIATRDGTVYEQLSAHRVDIERGTETLEILSPTSFYAVGFHENGFNQAAGRIAAEFVVENASELSRSVLVYAGYGEFEVLVNGRTVVANTSFPLAVCSHDHVEVTLVPGANTVEYRTTGRTGCFQNPGPALLVYRRK
jgi:hypothetical protein